MHMSKRWIVVSLVAVALVAGYLVGNRQSPVQGQEEEGLASGFAAVPDAVGAMDVTGPYDVVADWPKDISTLPGQREMDLGRRPGRLRREPQPRVYVVQRGQLPVLPEIQGTRAAAGRAEPLVPGDGAAPERHPGEPARRARGQRQGGRRLGRGQGRRRLPLGELHRRHRPQRQHHRDLEAVGQDAAAAALGVTSARTIRRSTSGWWTTTATPIFKFTNDGKTLLQTIGEPNVHASDDKHFYRPTFMAWQPDGSFYVSDGYANTRVVKFDKDGKYLTAWGERGTPPKETRPNYFNNVHGVAVDPGHAPGLRQRPGQPAHPGVRRERQVPAHVEGRPRRAPTCTSCTSTPTGGCGSTTRSASSSCRYDLEGRLVYAWGSLGAFPGALWGVHGISVDQEQNLYLAAVGRGGVQKFRRVTGANPAYLVGKHVATRPGSNSGHKAQGTSHKFLDLPFVTCDL